MATKEEQMIITKYDLLYEQRMTRVETTLEGMKKNDRGFYRNEN